MSMSASTIEELLQISDTIVIEMKAAISELPYSEVIERVEQLWYRWDEARRDYLAERAPPISDPTLMEELECLDVVTKSMQSIVQRAVGSMQISPAPTLSLLAEMSKTVEPLEPPRELEAAFDWSRNYPPKPEAFEPNISS